MADLALWLTLSLSLASGHGRDLSATLSQRGGPPRVEDMYKTISLKSGCHLKLICLLSQQSVNGQAEAGADSFMPGIRYLASSAKNDVASQLKAAIIIGERGGDCETVAQHCHQTSSQLLKAVHHLQDITKEETIFRQGRSTRDERTRPKRRKTSQRRQQNRNPMQQFLATMPPNGHLVRPRGATGRKVCQDCDSRGTVCTVFSVGSYVGCSGAWLVAGFPGQIACNVITAPGSLACTANTISCYMEDCGFVNLENLPSELG